MDVSKLTFGALQEQEAKEMGDRAVGSSTAKRVEKIVLDAQKAGHAAALKADEKRREETEKAEVKALMLKINRYIAAFPEIQAELPKLSSKPSKIELLEVLEQVRFLLDTQRSFQTLTRYKNMAINFVGDWWGDGSKMTFVPKPFRLNLTGIKELNAKGLFEELDPILMEIDIEYPWIGRQGLLVRALGAVGDILLKVHMMNTNPQAMAAINLTKSPPKAVPGMDQL